MLTIMIAKTLEAKEEEVTLVGVGVGVGVAIMVTSVFSTETILTTEVVIMVVVVVVVVDVVKEITLTMLYKLIISISKIMKLVPPKPPKDPVSGGSVNHWSKACRTPSHLCELYQASRNEKEKEVNHVDQFDNTNTELIAWDFFNDLDL
ncbi:hypothetical protein Tco_1170118 [Tanacetum coccineum]